MERPGRGFAGGVGPPRRVDLLVATALLQALHPAGGPEAHAQVLSRLADGHPEALELAVGQILRREHGRPTRVTVAATDSLRLARRLMRSMAGLVGEVSVEALDEMDPAPEAREGLDALLAEVAADRRAAAADRGSCRGTGGAPPPSSWWPTSSVPSNSAATNTT